MRVTARVTHPAVAPQQEPANATLAPPKSAPAPSPQPPRAALFTPGDRAAACEAKKPLEDAMAPRLKLLENLPRLAQQRAALAARIAESEQTLDASDGAARHALAANKADLDLLDADIAHGEQAQEPTAAELAAARAALAVVAKPLLAYDAAQGEAVFKIVRPQTFSDAMARSILTTLPGLVQGAFTVHALEGRPSRILEALEKIAAGFHPSPFQNGQ